MSHSLLLFVWKSEVERTTSSLTVFTDRHQREMTCLIRIANFRWSGDKGNIIGEDGFGWVGNPDSLRRVVGGKESGRDYTHKHTDKLTADRGGKDVSDIRRTPVPETNGGSRTVVRSYLYTIYLLISSLLPGFTVLTRKVWSEIDWRRASSFIFKFRR